MADLKPMEETIAEKDVGVTIDNKLSFDKHITEKVNKANSIIGVIRRTLEYLDLYDKSESPGISFVALLCIFSIMSMCFLRYGFQTGFAYSR
jgi:hypothetical protein